MDKKSSRIIHARLREAGVDVPAAFAPYRVAMAPAGAQLSGTRNPAPIQGGVHEESFPIILLPGISVALQADSRIIQPDELSHILISGDKESEEV